MVRTMAVREAAGAAAVAAVVTLALGVRVLLGKDFREGTALMYMQAQQAAGAVLVGKVAAALKPLTRQRTTQVAEVAAFLPP